MDNTNNVINDDHKSSKTKREKKNKETKGKRE